MSCDIIDRNLPKDAREAGGRFSCFAFFAKLENRPPALSVSEREAKNSFTGKFVIKKLVYRLRQTANFPVKLLLRYSERPILWGTIHCVRQKALNGYKKCY